MPNHFVTVGICGRDYESAEKRGIEDVYSIDLSPITSDVFAKKWAIYDVEVHRLGGDGAPLMISFQSAWVPPPPGAMQSITKYLCETFCLKDFKWLGHDPYDNSTHLIEVTERESVAD